MIQTILTIFFSCLCAFLYVYAILLLFGIGGGILAGYESNKPESKKDQKKVLQKFGIRIFVLTLLVHIAIELMIYKFYWIGIIFIIIILMCIGIGLFILNNNK